MQEVSFLSGDDFLAMPQRSGVLAEHGGPVQLSKHTAEFLRIAEECCGS